MTVRAILYSNQRRHRLARHLLLWTAYAAYFTLQSYFPNDGETGISGYYVRVALVSTAVFFPFCFLSAWLLLYSLYPRYLQRGRLLSFFGSLLALFLLGLVINYGAGLLFYRYSGRGPGTWYRCLFLGQHNVAIAMLTGLFILGLRLGRKAWLERMANLRLATQKARAEVRLLKTRIDPAFLFPILDRLRIELGRSSPEAPADILRLSETLSATLYEGEGNLALSSDELPRDKAEEPAFRPPATAIDRRIYAAIFSPKPRIRIARHSLFWLLRFVNLTVVSHSRVFWPDAPAWLNWGTAMRSSLSELAAEIVLTYSIAYGLYSWFFERKKYLLFTLGALALSGAVIFLTYPNQLDFHFTHDDKEGFNTLWNSFMEFIRMSFTTWLLFIAWRMFKGYFRRMTERATLSKEKADVEFQLLKAQVHPHFLFNTLNNIYSFALDGSPRAGELLARLSSMMRYMIFDCEADRMPLERELYLLEDYLGLEKARYGDRLDLQVSIEGETWRRQIAPLLMIPFVENCFKHGASQVLDYPWVRLRIRVRGNQLDFKLSNKMPPADGTGTGQNAPPLNGENATALNERNAPALNEDDVLTRNRKKGIGLKNIRQRLELLYPNRYQLDIDSAGDIFSVRMIVPLEVQDNTHGH